MLASSDKVVRYKREFVTQLNHFAGLEPSREAVDAALQFISPEPETIWIKPAPPRPRGAVNMGLLRTGVLRGWARSVHHNRLVAVQIKVSS